MGFIQTLFLSISLFVSPVTATNEELQVEIFDIETEKVVKTITKSDSIQEESEKIISNIYDIFKGINPIPDRGFMIKIPLEPKVTIDNEWLTAEVDTVIIIQPLDEKPYLLTFDEENRPRVFLFNAPIDELLNQLDYPSSSVSPTITLMR
ncbi:hypothetical protein [Piscibacillus salipiscarius]|uniref:Group-specific protein n=1 Tax=Piscibacillus salipiscarius TaxID=299480 RepID=A0ABW5Q6E7_9BACI|nr:hypothetical protein [Piscibacillus salipiscarius]